MILSKANSFDGPSFSRRNRLARLAWQIVWLLLFRPTPPPLHAWRCCLLRCFGARIGSYCHVYSNVEIWAPWNLQMASYSCLGRRVICYSIATVALGERAVVSQGVHLCTGSHDYDADNFQLFARPILIGSHAWICAESFLAPGVSKGDGAVIGARSVVTCDQPKWMVCAGNPCRPLKPRKEPNYPCS
jgi:putative colanic acid biosynthesis acetyltransferase WcaF